MLYSSLSLKNIKENFFYDTQEILPFNKNNQLIKTLNEKNIQEKDCNVLLTQKSKNIVFYKHFFFLQIKKKKNRQEINNNKKKQLIYKYNKYYIVTYIHLIKNKKVNQIQRSDANLSEKNLKIKKQQKHYLKYNDIVYFKYYVGKQKGLISGIFFFSLKILINIYIKKIQGDGISYNTLQCIPVIKNIGDENFEESIINEVDEKKQQEEDELKEEELLNKNPLLEFRKCLFRITNAKNYYYQNLLQKERINLQKQKITQNIFDEYEKKAKEEEMEYKKNYETKIGQNILYGQEIQLVHIFSGFNLKINQNKLAFENCCKEVCLVKKPNQWCNFIINSAYSQKNQGEPVLYSDQIFLCNALNQDFQINISVNQEIINIKNPKNYIFKINQKQIVLINQFRQKQKIYWFKQRLIKQSKFRKNQLQSGNLIYIINGISKSQLLVNQKTDFNSLLKKKIIYYKNNDHDTYIYEQKLDFIDYNFLNTKIQQQYELCTQSLTLEQEEQDKNQIKRIQSVWEIQKSNSFDSEICNLNQQYKIKNVYSGLFLCINTQQQLSLTFNGNCKEALFTFNPKNSTVQEFPFVRLKQDLKIQQYYNSQTLQLFCDVQELEKQHKVTLIDKRNVEKLRRNQVKFQLTLVDIKLSKLVDRIHSVITYLINFYFFMQKWGLEKVDGKLFYTYQQVFENQKQLHIKIEQLEYCLKYILNYLKSNNKLKQKQEILLDSDITVIIYNILKIIICKMYEQYNLKQQKFAKTPHKFANTKLQFFKNIILNILIIYFLKKCLYQCVYENYKCCQYFLCLQDDDFLLNQTYLYPTEASNLLTEIVKRTINGNTQKTVGYFIDKLDSINYKNIQKQTFIINLLCLCLCDNLDNPIKQFQNSCRKFIFKQYKSCVSANSQENQEFLCPIQYTLINFDLINNKPIVIFNKNGYIKIYIYIKKKKKLKKQQQKEIQISNRIIKKQEKYMNKKRSKIPQNTIKFNLIVLKYLFQIKQK
ncbi:hypothetical protein IMG5_062450 [Ichthyophthirius multifiliis]|uniref:Inositol 1,4,5-trisphosphate/ryanodine receptor domain-containing protein n=1 Tax=Ichthyophthirius multifiliis TaxID=5932 RepID=G0QNY0_ICHMU|nr:hypothetical protein IMG5_062450 [Ichthyophthirius multifiliis]EGR33067.1 hypothetical protein IMG5_062450 [Ichthyophthirius multifiliis]|eukprot:XP_004037053.1 hypothetical protein IMG5_062450 [Ichthyophthirius multifiliis]